MMVGGGGKPGSGAAVTPIAMPNLMVPPQVPCCFNTVGILEPLAAGGNVAGTVAAWQWVFGSARVPDAHLLPRRCDSGIALLHR